MASFVSPRTRQPIRRTLVAHSGSVLKLNVAPVPRGLTVRLSGLPPATVWRADAAGADKVVRLTIAFAAGERSAIFHLGGEIVAPAGADPRLVATPGGPADVDPIEVRLQYDCPIDSPNVAAFLHLIRLAEHYPTDDDAKAYSSVFGGGRFTDDSTHPSRTPTHAWGQTSTAAGAYQILYGTWLQAVQNGVVSDFKPASQDKLAYTLIKGRGALDAVCGGDLDTAFRLLRLEWTSLPGASQSRYPAAAARADFQRFGGAPAAGARP